jgi:hypothetical protein
MALNARNHNPFAEQKEFLYMLVDITEVEHTKVLAVGNMRRTQLLGRLKAAEGRQVIAPPIEGRGFSKLSLEQLQYLFWHVAGVTPPTDYAELVKECERRVNEIKPNEEHIPSLEFLVKQLEKNEGKLADGTLVDPDEPKPVVRPKGTTTTGIIWTICDEVLKELRNGEVPADTEGWKPVRAEAAKRCDAEGFHTGTFGVQYGKWKGNKLAPAQ